MTDIKVDDDWQITRAANGDAPLTGNEDEFLQSIRLESMTQERDLFYDLEYGWSLLDFVHSTDSKLTRTAIRGRVRTKMSRRDEVDISTLEVNVAFQDDRISIPISFQRKDTDRRYTFEVALDRIKMEVITK